MLEALGREHELPGTALADELGVGLPMLSRHLSVLRSAGLVTERRLGRQRLHRLCPEPLRELHDWAAVVSDFWTERVGGLRDYLDRTAPNGSRSSCRTGARTSGSR